MDIVDKIYNKFDEYQFAYEDYDVIEEELWKRAERFYNYCIDNNITEEELDDFLDKYDDYVHGDIDLLAGIFSLLLSRRNKEVFNNQLEDSVIDDITDNSHDIWLYNSDYYYKEIPNEILDNIIIDWIESDVHWDEKNENKTYTMKNIKLYEEWIQLNEDGDGGGGGDFGGDFSGSTLSNTPGMGDPNPGGTEGGGTSSEYGSGDRWDFGAIGTHPMFKLSSLSDTSQKKKPKRRPNKTRAKKTNKKKKK